MADSNEALKIRPERSSRIRVRRVPERAVYDRDAIYAVLDAGLLCHVGYQIDGQPYVTPTSYWREGDVLYWHGSSASRMLRHLAEGTSVCVTVTHLDGLVLARSGFHHTVNYRSVMALGIATPLANDERKIAALKNFMERLFPGRWDEVRPPTNLELKATTVLTMKLDEVSAKIRNAPPTSDEADYLLPCWAGVIPLGLDARVPVADPKRLKDEPIPSYAETINRRFAISLPHPLRTD